MRISVEIVTKRLVFCSRESFESQFSSLSQKSRDTFSFSKKKNFWIDLIVNWTISLVDLCHSSIDGFGWVTTFVGSARALEVFVFDHPELFAVVKAF